MRRIPEGKVLRNPHAPTSWMPQLCVAGSPPTAQTRSVVENILADSLCSVSSQNRICRDGFIGHRMNDGVADFAVEQESQPARGVGSRRWLVDVEVIKLHAVRSDGGDLRP